MFLSQCHSLYLSFILEWVLVRTVVILNISSYGLNDKHLRLDFKSKENK